LPPLLTRSTFFSARLLPQVEIGQLPWDQMRAEFPGISGNRLQRKRLPWPFPSFSTSLLSQATSATGPLLLHRAAAAMASALSHLLTVCALECASRPGLNSPQLLVMEADGLNRKHLNVGKRLQHQRLGTHPLELELATRRGKRQPGTSHGGFCFCPKGQGQAFRAVGLGFKRGFAL
jgi:hypothetical protein